MKWMKGEGTDQEDARKLWEGKEDDTDSAHSPFVINKEKWVRNSRGRHDKEISQTISIYSTSLITLNSIRLPFCIKPVIDCMMKVSSQSLFVALFTFSFCLSRKKWLEAIHQIIRIFTVSDRQVPSGWMEGRRIAMDTWAKEKDGMR